MFWMMFYDWFLVSWGDIDWLEHKNFANDETFWLLDMLAEVPFETAERYWRFSLSPYEEKCYGKDYCGD